MDSEAVRAELEEAGWCVVTPATFGIGDLAERVQKTAETLGVIERGRGQQLV